MQDDAITGPVPIGFEFCYWGNKYQSCYIGSNGWLGFSAGQPIAFTPFMIPTLNAFTPKNCIMGPFHDLNPGYPTPQPCITYYTTGTAPNRKFVVSYTLSPMYQCTASKSSQQIVIYESSNRIRTTITQKSNCVIWVQGFATHGLHNINGTQAVVVPGRNAQLWSISSPETWDFIPPPCQCSNLDAGIDMN